MTYNKAINSLKNRRAEITGKHSRQRPDGFMEIDHSATQARDIVARIHGCTDDVETERYERGAQWADEISEELADAVKSLI